MRANQKAIHTKQNAAPVGSAGDIYSGRSSEGREVDCCAACAETDMVL